MTDILTLVVDDQADIRLLMKVLLDVANHGLRVTTAACGPEALARVEADDPVVVVLDNMMPGMTGIETGCAIRARRPHQRMVLCSAYLSDVVRQQAADAGFGECLAKEDIAMLPAVVRTLAAS